MEIYIREALLSIYRTEKSFTICIRNLSDIDLVIHVCYPVNYINSNIPVPLFAHNKLIQVFLFFRQEKSIAFI